MTPRRSDFFHGLSMHAGGADMNAHVNYIARLFQGLPPPSEAELFCQTHKALGHSVCMSDGDVFIPRDPEDCLQAPLQPLKELMSTPTTERLERSLVQLLLPYQLQARRRTTLKCRPTNFLSETL
eukprot:3009685-Amphidinium_carterae.1